MALLLVSEGRFNDLGEEKLGTKAFKKRHRRADGANRLLLVFFLILLVIATFQLIHGNYHVKKHLYFPLYDDERSSTGDLYNVMHRLQRFRKGNKDATALETNNREIRNNHILTILEKSGIELPPELMDQIPPFSHVEQMYGSKPIILGLDRCEEFRQNIDPSFRIIGAAGMFNTGTNLLYEYLSRNCLNPARLSEYDKGIHWQVPWGKHSPLSYRGLRYAETDDATRNLDNFLPIVMIKDPYTWMQSLCRNQYTADWDFTLKHCPNLIPNEVDKYYGFVNDIDHEKQLLQNGIPMTIAYNPNTTQYNNMAAAWNTWYGEYFEAKIPRLIVRFEDLMLHAKSIITEICQCFGGRLKNETKFHYVTGSSKSKELGHGNFTPGLMHALLLYTNSSNRIKLFTKDDLVFANEVLNKTMMGLLSYSIPSSDQLTNPWRTVPFRNSTR